MQYFYNVETNDPYQTEDPIRWSKPKYQAYQFQADPKTDVYVPDPNWIKFKTADLDKMITILKKSDFIPTFFQTSNHQNEQLNEYDGEELLGNPSDQTPVKTFENQTDEQIQVIQFNHRTSVNQKLLINQNGLVGENHLTEPQLKKLWNPIIRRILNERAQS